MKNTKYSQRLRIFQGENVSLKAWLQVKWQFQKDYLLLEHFIYWHVQVRTAAEDERVWLRRRDWKNGKSSG